MVDPLGPVGPIVADWLCFPSSGLSGIQEKLPALYPQLMYHSLDLCHQRRNRYSMAGTHWNVELGLVFQLLLQLDLRHFVNLHAQSFLSVLTLRRVSYSYPVSMC